MTLPFLFYYLQINFPLLYYIILYYIILYYILLYYIIHEIQLTCVIIHIHLRL